MPNQKPQKLNRIAHKGPFSFSSAWGDNGDFVICKDHKMSTDLRRFSSVIPSLLMEFKISYGKETEQSLWQDCLKTVNNPSFLKNYPEAHVLSWISPKPTKASSLLMPKSFWMTISTFPKGIPYWKRKQPMGTRSPRDQAAGHSSQHTFGGQVKTHWKTKTLLQTEALLL